MNAYYYSYSYGIEVRMNLEIDHRADPDLENIFAGTTCNIDTVIKCKSPDYVLCSGRVDAS